MPHFPKPFFRPSRGLWYIQLGGKQFNLGNGTEEEAVEAAVELKKKLRDEAAAREQAGPIGEYLETLAVKFVEWCYKNRAEGTAARYQTILQSFLDHAGDIRVSDLKPFHLDEWCDEHPNWSDGMKRGAMMAVQRCLNWAAMKGYIPYSPIAKIEKPQGGKRDYLITSEEYERILSQIRSVEFRELLTVAWETGCRPEEILIVEARHVDLKNSRWIFERENSKGKKRQRVVYLNDAALDTTKRLMLKHPEGPLFRTESGVPWTPHSVNCQFVRMQQRMGRAVMREKKLNASEKEVRALMKVINRRPGMKESEVREIARARIRAKMATQFAPKYCLYLFRHAWMTRLLQANIDPITVSTLAGHVDTSMLARQYQHLAHDPKYLLEKVKRTTDREAG